MAIPAHDISCPLCLLWKVMAAIIRDDRAGGWVERDQKNKERCCVGTVLDTDLVQGAAGMQVSG